MNIHITTEGGDGREQVPPKCPRCGNNRQVWVNQHSGRWTCHRAFCDTVIEAAQPIAAHAPAAPLRVYLSGPMSGLPEHNRPAFHAAAAALRALGYDVVNPSEINPPSNATWEQCLRKDVAALTTCDAVALLPGWEASSGAHVEVHLAHRLGLWVVALEALAQGEGRLLDGRTWDEVPA